MKRFLFVFLCIFVFCQTAMAADFIAWDAPAVEPSVDPPDGYFISFTDGTDIWNSGPIGDILEYDLALLNIPHNVEITYTVVAYNLDGETSATPIVWTKPGFTPPGQILPPPGQTKPGKPGNPHMDNR